MLRKNLFANYLGQAWTALMGVAFLPIYIKYLGIEAFGLVGLFAVLSAALVIVDMGLTPALGREMARFTGGHKNIQAIRDLLRTIEWIGVGIALLIGMTISLGAHWLAQSWLKVDQIPISTVAKAFMIMGLVIALRFVEGIYRSSIIGLQRQVAYNIINSTIATIRAGGAVFILAWVSPTVEAFFYWQAFISLIGLMSLVWLTYSAMPDKGSAGHFSLSALSGVWQFSGGVFGIAVLGMMLTQIDKIVLSRLLSLTDFGLYAFAGTVAGAIYMTVGPITQAWYPRLCELHARNDFEGLAVAYHRAAQLVSVVTGGFAAVLIVFSESILLVWTQDVDLAEQVAPILRLLAIANLLNSLTQIPYYTQLAHGWTSLVMRFGLISLPFYLCIILWVTPRYGVNGATTCYVILNFLYLLVVVHLMHKKILCKEKMDWLIQDVFLPLCSAFIVASLFKFVWGEAENTTIQFLWLLFASICTIGASALTSPIVRRELEHFFLVLRSNL